ncbi:MAG TPA: hypothetical protein VFT67_15640 [Jatrophihabitantaceae bacterium]|nr:hypothetical protein [Jatrophihabitantaceae bacterium]
MTSDARRLACWLFWVALPCHISLRCLPGQRQACGFLLAWFALPGSPFAWGCVRLGNDGGDFLVVLLALPAFRSSPAAFP